MSLRKKLASILEKTAEVLKEDDTKERLHLALVERQNKIDERVLRLRRSPVSYTHLTLPTSDLV